MSFYDPILETLDRDVIGRKQEEGFRRLMAALEGNPFYRAKLEAAGKSASDVQDLKDLASLPFGTYND